MQRLNWRVRIYMELGIVAETQNLEKVTYKYGMLVGQAIEKCFNIWMLPGIDIVTEFDPNYDQLYLPFVGDFKEGVLR